MTNISDLVRSLDVDVSTATPNFSRGLITKDDPFQKWVRIEGKEIDAEFYLGLSSLLLSLCRLQNMREDVFFKFLTKLDNWMAMNHELDVMEKYKGIKPLCGESICFGICSRVCHFC